MNDTQRQQSKTHQELAELPKADNLADAEQVATHTEPDAEERESVAGKGQITLQGQFNFSLSICFRLFWGPVARLLQPLTRLLSDNG